MWSGLEVFITLNLSTQEVRVLANWSNLDLLEEVGEGTLVKLGVKTENQLSFQFLG